MSKVFSLLMIIISQKITFKKMVQLRVLEEDQVFISQRYKERNESSSWKNFGFTKPIIYKIFETSDGGFGIGERIWWELFLESHTQSRKD